MVLLPPVPNPNNLFFIMPIIFLNCNTHTSLLCLALYRLYKKQSKICKIFFCPLLSSPNSSLLIHSIKLRPIATLNFLHFPKGRAVLTHTSMLKQLILSVMFFHITVI